MPPSSMLQTPSFGSTLEIYASLPNIRHIARVSPYEHWNTCIIIFMASLKKVKAKEEEEKEDEGKQQ